ncbi:MAG: class I SAM-dependent methyltransferase [Candidatus Berkiellales bacterium]
MKGALNGLSPLYLLGFVPIALLVGQDNDPSVSSSCAHERQKRVVVKRQHYAPPLKAESQLQFTGRSHRFDIYFIY